MNNVVAFPEPEEAGSCPFCDSGSSKTRFRTYQTTHFYERECTACGHAWDGECRGIDGNIDLRGDGT